MHARRVPRQAPTKHPWRVADAIRAPAAAGKEARRLQRSGRANAAERAQDDGVQCRMTPGAAAQLAARQRVVAGGVRRGATRAPRGRGARQAEAESHRGAELSVGHPRRGAPVGRPLEESARLGRRHRQKPGPSPRGGLGVHESTPASHDLRTAPRPQARGRRAVGSLDSGERAPSPLSIVARGDLGRCRPRASEAPNQGGDGPPSGQKRRHRKIPGRGLIIIEMN